MLQEYTIEELQVEHLMHAIEADPYQQYPRASLEDVVFRTGDPLIDKWEKQLGDGKDAKDIDWDEGVDQDFLKRFKAHSIRTASRGKMPVQQQPTQPPPDVDLSDIIAGFSDDYTEG